MRAIADEPLGVVLVDPDPVFSKLVALAAAQKSNFTIFQARSGAALDALLSERQIDCIVLGDEHGDMGGPIQRRLDDERPGHPPIVMLTALGKGEAEADGPRPASAGAHMNRAFRSETFVDAVVRAVDEGRRRPHAAEEIQRPDSPFSYDRTTGFESRSSIDERLARLAALAPPARSAFAMILIELADHAGIVERFG